MGVIGKRKREEDSVLEIEGKRRERLTECLSLSLIACLTVSSCVLYSVCYNVTIIGP